jgi:hypothetical protein
MSKAINEKIDDALLNFYLEADKSIIKELIDEEIDDADQYAKKKKQIMFLAKAAAKQKHDEYLLTLVAKFQDAILRNVEKPIAVLKQLIQTDASLALYNNLDKLSNEDIVEIIKDKNLVELLEELDKNEGK